MTRKFGPKSTDHPSVGEPCPVCGIEFQPGDYTTLRVQGPANEEEARKAEAGKAYTATAIEIHWDCQSEEES